MTTKIYYFTGTGNSLALAEKLAGKLDAELVNIEHCTDENIVVEADCMGIVFPVYAFGVPMIVNRFVDKLRSCRAGYVFAVCNPASCQGHALSFLKDRLAGRNIRLDASISIDMPSNYIPFGGAEKESVQQRKFAKAERRLDTFAAIVRMRKTVRPDNFMLLPRFVSTLSHRFFMRYLKHAGAKFRSADACTGCGLCEKLCPVDNITIIDGRPRWSEHCELCMRCLQYCPAEAIRYGNVPPERKRYHHPDVQAQELLRSPQP